MSEVIVECIRNKSDGICLGTLFVPLLDKDIPLCCAIYPYSIHIFDLKGAQIVHFTTSNKILAFNSISPEGLAIHWILLLTELNELYVLALKYTSSTLIDLLIIKHFKFTDLQLKKNILLDIENQKKIVNFQKCFIKVDESSRFIIIHLNRGFIIQLELQPSKKELFKLASLNKQPKEIKKTNELLKFDKYKVMLDPNSFWISTDIVIDLQIFKSGSVWWILILSRNIKLEYILKFYLLKKQNSIGFKLFKTITSIKSIPQLIIPLNNFLIHIFSYELIIYGMPNAALVNETDNSVLEDSCLIQKLNFTNGLNKFFQTYSIVDQKSILLITSDNEFYKIELEYVYDSGETLNMGKRTRRMNADEIIPTLTIKQWRIVGIKSDVNKILNNHFQIFQFNDKFYSFNKYSQFFSFELKGDKMIENYIIDSSVNEELPIIDMEIRENQLNFISGDTNHSYFRSSNFELITDLEFYKKHITINNFTVILTEFKSSTLSDDVETLERIDIYSKSGENISSYDLEENIKVLNMFPLKSFKPYMPDGNDFLISEVHNIQSLLENSFIVITSSNNIEDYGNDDDFIHKRRTEILLFLIDKENQLQLKTISVVNAKIESTNLLDDRTLLFWGPYYCLMLSLELYREVEESNEVQLKFIKLNEKNFGVSKISVSKRLNDKFWLLVDPFLGLNIIRIDPITRQVFKHRLIFKWNSITSLDVFSEDSIIIGDSLGNVFLININYNNPRLPTCEIFTKFNIKYGFICDISCYNKDSIHGSPNKLKYATIGTSEGFIFTIYIMNSVNKKDLKLQNGQLIKDILFNIESASKLSSDMLKALKCIDDDRELFFQLLPLLESRFIKNTILTNQKLDEAENSEVCVIFK